MIIDAFKNKMFSVVPTFFSENEASEKSFKQSSKSEELSKSKDEKAREEVFNKVVALDNVLQPGLIKKYFGSNSSVEMFKEFINYKKKDKVVKKLKIFRIEVGLNALKKT